jgi:hypothetical protein
MANDYQRPFVLLLQNRQWLNLEQARVYARIVRLILIIYRFSQDIQLIDKQLPSALQTIVTRRYSISSFKKVLR